MLLFYTSVQILCRSCPEGKRTGLQQYCCTDSSIYQPVVWIWEIFSSKEPHSWATTCIPAWKREANTGCLPEMDFIAGSKERNPFRESGELCPKPQRWIYDLSGRWAVQFFNNFRKMQFISLQWGVKIVCSAIRPKVQMPVPWYIQWPRWTKHTT